MQYSYYYSLKGFQIVQYYMWEKAQILLNIEIVTIKNESSTKNVG